MPTIRELRKAGRLEEAYELGTAQLEQRPEDAWLKRDLAWVYYDLAKNAVESSSQEEFFVQLRNIARLGFDGRVDTIVADNVMYLVNKWGYNHIVNIADDSKRINAVQELIMIVQELPKNTPSEPYSAYTRWVHRSIKGSRLYVSIMRRIGLDALAPSDYLPVVYNDQKLMSLAEQVYIAYAKGLIDAINYLHTNVRSSNYILYCEEARSFLKRLETIEDTHPEYQYTLYYIVKIMLVLGENHQIIERLIPFVQRKSKDFWVWQQMAQVLEKTNKSAALACCCKGLLCRSEEDKVVGLREYAAIIFADQGYYQEAKTEIEIVDSTRQRYWGKGITNEALLAIMRSDAYRSAERNENNRAFYRKHAAPAEDLVYRTQATPILITFVNQEKGFASFLSSKDEPGFFSYERVLKVVPAQNEVYDVVWDTRRLPYCKAIWCQKHAHAETTAFYQQIDGVISIRDNQPFGFINREIFMSPQLIEAHNLHHGDRVQCVVVKCYDKKKSRVGWAVHSILKHAPSDHADLCK